MTRPEFPRPVIERRRTPLASFQTLLGAAREPTTYRQITRRAETPRSKADKQESRLSDTQGQTLPFGTWLNGTGR